MYRPREHNVLLLAIVLLTCAVAATMTLVSTAQTQNEPDPVKAAKKMADDAALSSVEPENETKTTSDSFLHHVSKPIDDHASTRTEPARTITIEGRALDDLDRGRPNAVVTLREADGTSHSATADKRGNFRFEKIADGQHVELSAVTGADASLNLKLQLKGETRVFWRIPYSASKTKSGTY